jgi:transcriptional regulator with XRE-family HTH domain
MAGNGRKPTQQNKLLEDQIQEQRARVDSQVKEEHKRWCALIAERRAAAKLTISQLAKIAGVDQRTIKNIEHEICQSIAPATLNRLRSVPQLRLPITLDADSLQSSPGYHAIWLPNYSPSYTSDLAHSALKFRWGRFPFFGLNHSKSSTDMYQYLISSGSYGDWINESYQCFEQMVSCLNQFAADPFDLVSLTIGYGWAELKIAESLLSVQSNRLTSIALVSPNVNLLYHGLHVFKRQMYIPERLPLKTQHRAGQS